MDELTLLRNMRDDSREPSPTALAAGRAALLGRIADDATYATAQHRKKRRWMPRLTGAAAGVAAAMTGVLVVGNVTLSAQSAYASDVLRTAATQTIQYADLVAGSDQYLRSHTHARWGVCDATGCEPNDQIMDVYMPADPEAEWTLYRDWGNMPGVLTGESIETTRAVDGRFYDPGHSWVNVDYADIPLDGAAAYEWIDAQYNGGSASRDEDNFVRITDILRSGLVPAPQRAALLDALSRISGVTATDNVANLDGVTGIAIGRNEMLRAGERQEIIIDPDTGLVIGERAMSGTTLFGWGVNEEMSLTAIETTVVDTAP
ncbi:hypothetical protein E3O25_12355 [Cryobacterium sp. TMT1-3]|uniref:hypothetical protein n=1 Tax=Cryobacterium sp. TMT1-3 TaxID=1259237 RepID=UPI00106A84BC|nr:hypothetical protein [Cryobacterium sp. TMT1-3]TFC25411.1 hypothetical protein E3O25_12355 [Cryobacterium sp. TMT1-3]